MFVYGIWYPRTLGSALHTHDGQCAPHAHKRWIKNTVALSTFFYLEIGILRVRTWFSYQLHAKKKFNLNVHEQIKNVSAHWD